MGTSYFETVGYGKTQDEAKQDALQRDLDVGDMGGISCLVGELEVECIQEPTEDQIGKWVFSGEGRD
jgi:hypothetical protein